MAFVASGCAQPDSSEPVGRRNPEQRIHVTALTLKDSNRFGQISIEYPQIAGLADPKLTQAINDTFATRARRTFDSNGVRRGFDPAGSDIAKDHSSYIYEEGFQVKYPTPNLIEFDLWFQQFLGGAHPFAGSDALWIDIRNGRRVAEHELFRSDVLYAKALSPICIRKLLARGAEYVDSSWVLSGAGPDSSNYKGRIHLTDQGLIVRFAEYQVAAYAAGQPEVLIPYHELRQYLNPDIFDLTGIAPPQEKSVSPVSVESPAPRSPVDPPVRQQPPPIAHYVIDHSVNRLENFIYTIQGVIEHRSLLNKTVIGGEPFWQSRLLSVSLDTDVLSPVERNERFWLLALFRLASDMAMDKWPERFRPEDMQNDPYYKFIKEHWGDVVSGMVEALKPKSTSNAVNAAREALAEGLRNAGAKAGHFKSTDVTYRTTFKQVGSFVGAIALVLTYLDATSHHLDECQKLMAQAVSAGIIMDRTLAPMLRMHPIYSRQTVRNSLQNFWNASDQQLQALGTQYSTFMAMTGAAYLAAIASGPTLYNLGFAAGAAATPEFVGAGGFVGAAIALVIGGVALNTVPESISDGTVFEFNNNIASRLFTIPYATTYCANEEIVLINASALMSASNLMEYQVRGKGVISGLGQMLGGDEKGWQEVYSNDIRPQADDVHTKIGNVLGKYR